ncbi:MAG TPA: LLM class flavin-dependent oxidoreductase [Gaiellaceae bacterium]|nr:LLM class flavin-dependent oxidoreductase [Gaiellaceae bacterium]
MREPFDPGTGVSNPVAFAVLDQSPIAEGETGADALRNTIDLARHAEELGYGRYWLAEHHGTPMLACAAPEIMIAEVAAATSRIRVGSGGVMLPHYSPYKVAETFSVLGGLHGDRIDLGIGRAPGTDVETMFALQRDRREMLPDDFTEQLTELLAYFEDGFPPDHAFSRLTRLPGAPGRADVWLLGSSPQSAIWAAELGLPYSIADFINPAGAMSARLYRERFDASRRRSEPTVSVAVGVVCAETRKEAERLASSWRMALALAARGHFGPVPGVEKALAFLAQLPGDPTGGRRIVVGPPGTVRAQLQYVAAEYGADEVMILTMTHDHSARRRSYELIAEELELGASPVPRQESSPAPAG